MSPQLKQTMFLIISLLCETAVVKSQSTFLKTFGGERHDEMHSMIRSHDNGFIMAGNTESFGQGNFDLTDDYIIKTDSDGNVEWSISMGLQDYDDIYWIEPTNDSAYVICGIASDNNTYIGILFAKISEEGNILWQKVFAHDQAGIGYCVKQTTDGGFIIAAEMIANDNLDFVLIKTNGDGDIQWSKEIGGADVDAPSYILPTADGGYFACGISRYGPYWVHVYSVKTDSAGNVVWQKSYNTFPYFSKCTVSNVIITSDGGYLIAGGTTHNEPQSDIMLLKIDSAGALQWVKAYGGNDNEYCGALIKNSNGHYVICGESASSSGTGYYDALVLLVDSAGNLLNSSLFGHINADDNFVSVLQLGDGGYMLGGTTSSFNVYERSDFMMMKLDKNFNGPECDTLTPNIFETDISFDDTTDVNQTNVTLSANDVDAFVDSGSQDSLICDVATGNIWPPSSQQELNIYPNPTSGSCVISFKNESSSQNVALIQVMSAQAKIVYSTQEIFSGNNPEKEIALPSSISSGVYIVQIILKEGVLSGKLIVSKQ